MYVQIIIIKITIAHRYNIIPITINTQTNIHKKIYKFRNQGELQ